MKAGSEDLLHLSRDLIDDADKLALGLLHVVALLRQKLIAGVDALIFLDGAEVWRTEGADLTAELGDLLVRLGQIFHGLAQGVGRAVAQLIVFPELVEDLFFLHLRAELFLLDARALALEIEDVRIAALRVLFGAGALALELKLLAGDLRDLFPDGGGLLPMSGKLRLPGLEALPEALDLPLRGLHRAAATLTVPAQALQQQPELGDGSGNTLLLGLKGSRSAADLRLILQRHIQLVADGGEAVTRLVQITLALFLVLGALDALFFELFQLVCAGEDASALRAAAAGHGAAGVNHLSVKRNNAQAVAVIFRHTHRILQGLCHHRAP